MRTETLVVNGQSVEVVPDTVEVRFGVEINILYFETYEDLDIPEVTIYHMWPWESLNIYGWYVALSLVG